MCVRICIHANMLRESHVHMYAPTMQNIAQAAVGPTCCTHSYTDIHFSESFFDDAGSAGVLMLFWSRRHRVSADNVHQANFNASELRQVTV